MKYRFFLFLILVQMLGYARAEDNSGYGTNNATLMAQLHESSLLESVQPILPSAQAITRCGNHTINLENGSIPIVIPIYEIKCGSLSVPINISYQSGGIKVDQDASWVGLGWNLNFGGVISRTLNGFMDEEESYQNEPDANQMLREMQSGNTNNLSYYSHLLNKSNPFKSHLSFTGNPTYSFNPDLFSYSIGNYSGTFFIDPTDKDTIHSLSYSTILGHFQKVGRSGMIGQAPFVTPEGNKYYFAVKEETSIASHWGRFYEYPSSYYVSAIVSPDGVDTIRYEYQNAGRYSKSADSYSKGLSSVLSTPLGINGQSTANPTLITSYSSTTLIIDTVKKPLYIYYKNHRISFILSNGLYTTKNTTCKRLDRIVIESLENGEYKVDKTIVFSYNRENDDRLYLSSVYERADDIQRLIASFEYCSSNFSGSDYWHYANGKLSSITGQNDNRLHRTVVNNQIIGTGNKTPDERYMQAGSLKKITYATGGSEEFEWEINRVRQTAPVYINSERISESKNVQPSCQCTDAVPPSRDEDDERVKEITIVANITQTAYLSYSMRKADTNSNVHYKYDKISLKINGTVIDALGASVSEKEATTAILLHAGDTYNITMESNCSNCSGSFSISYDSETASKVNDGWPFTGLRIKEITERDSNNKIIDKKRYEYLDPNGKCSGYLTTSYELSNTNRYLVEEIIQGGGAGSSQNVTLREYSNFMVCSNITNGPKDYEYAYEYVTETIIDGATNESVRKTKYKLRRCDDEQISGYTPVISKAHLRGQVLQKEVYEISGGEEILIQKTQNSYSIDESSPRKTGFLMRSQYAGATIDTEYLFRQIPSAPSVDILYQPLSFTYSSDWLRLDSTIVTEYKEDGRVLQNTTVYNYGNKLHALPTTVEMTQGSDSYITEIAYSGDLDDAISQTMIDRHMVALPVSQRLYHKGVNNGRTFQRGVRNEYDYSTLKRSATFDILPNGDEIVLNRYKYNDKKLLSEVRGLDSIPTAIKWNIYGNLPLMIAKGVSAEQMSISGQDRNTLQQAERTCQITTYTYNSDGSITSVTDPTGNVLYYEYDGLGRLVAVRDKYRRVLSSYEYQFQTDITR